ncbi:MAG: hypothetical protein ACKN9P_02280, partial [Phenylobacterium sp.]
MRTPLIAALALLAAACADRSVRATGPVQAGPWVSVVAEPVAADPTRPERTDFGRFRYAGGLALTATDSNRLHGLSDIRLRPDGQILGVTDEGDLFEARLRLDPEGRLSGLDRARITPLRGEGGGALGGKLEADAEGLALLRVPARSALPSCARPTRPHSRQHPSLEADDPPPAAAGRGRVGFLV